jgi:hypothetical protein
MYKVIKRATGEVIGEVDAAQYQPIGTGCAQCGRPLSPVDRMMGPVCGACCRKNHREATR